MLSHTVSRSAAYEAEVSMRLAEMQNQHNISSKSTNSLKHNKPFGTMKTTGESTALREYPTTTREPHLDAPPCRQGGELQS